MTPATISRDRASRPWDVMVRAAIVVCGVAPVWALLAWSAGLGAFRVWFLATGLPAIVGMVALAVAAQRSPATRAAVTAGVLGGIAGTVCYDLFRVPFTLLGYRLFAPIDTYGILLLGTDHSSGATAFAGWAFHLANGIGFALAYAAVASGRHVGWAVLWAMVLETATVATPFADVYRLRGQTDVIAIAYAAHVPYGIVVGTLARRAARLDGQVREMGRRTTAWIVLAVVVALAVWHRPGLDDADDRAGRLAAPGPSAVIRDRRLRPEWLRLPPGACASLRNDDAVEYQVPVALGGMGVVPGQTVRVCPEGIGVHRIQLSGIPYSGGSLIVDEEA